MSPYRKLKHARRTARTRRRRGVALIMVLAALVVLTVFATELQERTSATLAAASAERDALRGEYYARSAVNLTRLLIATEPVVRKAVDPMFRVAMKTPAPQIPVWKFTHLVLAPFNDANQSEDFTRVTQVSLDTGKNLGLNGGHFEFPIVVEEDALINVNAATLGDPDTRKQVSDRLLGLFGGAHFNELFEDEDVNGQYSNQPVICGALIDWSDFDEVMTPCDPFADKGNTNESPEDNFYQQIGLQYTRKNAPFDSLEELRLVRGVTDDFWANFVDPDIADPLQRTMTVWGQGKVNVNAANAQTLHAVVCAGAPEAPVCNDVEQMQIFLTSISLAKSITQGAPLFKSPKAFVRAMSGKGKGVGPLFAALGLEPIEFPNPRVVQRAITTESRVFSIYAQGVVEGKKRETRVRIHTVIDFRSANELGADLAAEQEQDKQAPKQGDPKADEDEEVPAVPVDPTPEQLAAALASDPMGVIIYHRLE